MKTEKILIIDDSKGRPFKGVTTTYVDELKKLLAGPQAKGQSYEIHIIGGEYYTSIDAVKEIDALREGERRFDHVIINLGINDCSPRLLVGWWRERLMRLPKGIGGFIRIRILRRYRKLWFKLFGSRLIVSDAEFKQNLLKIIDTVGAKAIIMTIGPTNAETEKKLPGITKNIARFNSRILELGREKRCMVADIHGLIENMGPQKALIDGVHYKEDTCKRIAAELSRMIKRK